MLYTELRSIARKVVYNTEVSDMFCKARLVILKGFTLKNNVTQTIMHTIKKQTITAISKTNRMLLVCT